MTMPAYPLAQIIDVKKRRVEAAEKVVAEKKEALKKEQDIMAQREAERDKAKKHYDDKLAQLRKSLDEESTSPKIQQMKVYLKIAKERELVEEKKVVEQKKQVDAAEKNLEAAQKDLKVKRQEVDKLLTHKIDWTKEMRKEMDVIEAREMDDIGSIIFTTRHPRKKS
jgi:hypothetical protein